MRRLALLLGALAIVGAAAGCDYKSNDFCFEIDGPCGGYPRATQFIVGFPVGAVDQSKGYVNAAGFPTTLHVGDTVTLHLVQNARGDVVSATDTVRTVTWILNDTTSATLTPLPGGAARLVATHPGPVGPILANLIVTTYACGPVATAYGCLPIGGITVR